MKAKLSDAPGCFGSPTVRAAASPVCDACVWRTACARYSVVHRLAMEKELAAFSWLKPEPTVDRAAEETAINAETLEVICAAHAQNITRESLDDLLSRPSETVIKTLQTMKPSHLRITVLMLKVFDKGFTKRQLIDRMIKSLGWTEAAASSRASSIVSSLSKLSLIQITSDSLITRNRI